LLAACSAAPDISQSSASDLTVAGTIGPQSFTHGTLTAGTPQLAYAFRGSAGVMIAPDVWPTGKSMLQPWLLLLGPRGPGGHRTLLARGSPRDGDPRHIAIDNFCLPETGSYLVLGGGDGGQFTLRLWMQSSLLPRQEGSQVDLSTMPSEAMLAAMHAHESGAAWTDGEVDALAAGIEQEPDLRVAMSDAPLLLWALTAPRGGSAHQIAQARAAAAKLVGTPQHFRDLDRGLQAFVLYWLGNVEGLFFTSAAAEVPPPVEECIAQLVAAWPGAREDRSIRRAQSKSFNGLVYGWQVEFAAEQRDTDGRQVWLDFATEWFDSSAALLGESSAGAGEPDD
jgi:hypothetical protein